MANEILYRPIGIFHSQQKHAYEAGRQPDENHEPGHIQLHSGQQFEQALTGLEKFTHIWVLFQFHHNNNWKPMVSPPRGSDGKVGVFATRSPYRPNNIGMSVLRLVGVENLKIHVAEADLLDGTPILDIKPYLPYVDAKTEANQGWIRAEDPHHIIYNDLAQQQLMWLKSFLPNLAGFISHQLQFEPCNHKKKRVKKTGDNSWVLSYRTWRVTFSLSEKNLQIEKISSGYSPTELLATEDPYQDKKLHLEFISFFSTQT